MKTIYCATPSRLNHLMLPIMDFVTNEGYGPIHPFQALPYERFEGGPIGRERTMEICCKLIEICDEFWIFGVSQGTLLELCHAIEHKIPIIPCFEFDPEWEKFYTTLKEDFGDPLSQFLHTPH